MPTSISHPWFHVTLSSLDYRVPVSVHITKLAKLSKWDEPYHPLLETVKCSSRRRPHCTLTTAWMRPARCWKPTAPPKGSAPRSAAQPTSPAGTSRPPHGGHAPSPPAPSEAPRLAPTGNPVTPSPAPTSAGRIRRPVRQRESLHLCDTAPLSVPFTNEPAPTVHTASSRTAVPRGCHGSRWSFGLAACCFSSLPSRRPPDLCRNFRARPGSAPSPPPSPLMPLPDVLLQALAHEPRFQAQFPDRTSGLHLPELPLSQPPAS